MKELTSGFSAHFVFDFSLGSIPGAWVEFRNNINEELDHCNRNEQHCLPTLPVSVFSYL